VVEQLLKNKCSSFETQLTLANTASLQASMGSWFHLDGTSKRLFANGLEPQQVLLKG
jgi:hypothetical protein